MKDTEAKTTHTPGPWTHAESAMSQRGNLWFVTSARVGQAVGVAETTSEANASLIAAAPDLLRALKNALVELQVNGDSIGAVVDVLESEGRAALAKAEGR